MEMLFFANYVFVPALPPVLPTLSFWRFQTGANDQLPEAEKRHLPKVTTIPCERRIHFFRNK
jgi:hypothetical protein